jgi:hypothetical protein
MNELGLFGEISRDPLLGLPVHLPSQCRCGATNATIGAGAGPHAASLRCANCNAHRGWVAHATLSFIAEIVNLFGRPTAPITIRRSERRQPNIPRVAGARRAQMCQAKQRRKETSMDMREFRKTRFLKVEDYRKPRQERIAGVVPGKYSKPDLVLESGDRLGLSATNIETLSDSYSWESEQWPGHLIELYVGQGPYEGNMVDMVLIRPLSPAEGDGQPANEPPAKKAPNKPPELKSSDAGIDDEIPF